MRRHKHLFEEVVSFDNLLGAARDALRGRRLRQPGASFYASLEEQFERYIKLFRDDELAQAIMHDVTGELVQLLVKVFEQQCDVVDKKVAVKTHMGGDIVCNPSDPDGITVSDFRIEDGEAKDDYDRTIIVPTCVECPAGQKPHRSFYEEFLQPINILQHPHVCAACPLLQKCPVRFASGWNQVTIEAKQVRLIDYRRKDKTTEFRDAHRLRSGIEATNSLLKRVTGLDRLCVRGRPAVFSSILLKVAGWNLLRAASVRSSPN